METWLRQTHQLHPHDSLQRGREERSSYGTYFGNTLFLYKNRERSLNVAKPILDGARGNMAIAGVIPLLSLYV